MKKSYEILPADMIASTMKGGGDVKEPKPYEILPGAGVAAQGLVGWTKEASWIARRMATQGAFSSQAVGLPYDPAGRLPAQGDAIIPRSGKKYEILPVGMSGSVTGSAAKVSKPYEIAPASETAAQGLGGWTKGASSIAMGLPTSGPSGNEGIGLPYDPAGAVPTRGAKPIPPAVKRSKEYEIHPGAGTANLGLGGKSGGCGCGGGCGGLKGYEILPTGMKKSGGCGSGKAGGCGCGGKCGGASKAGGCGCGGKCGGHGDGIVLPMLAGILLPPSWSSDVPSDVSRISEGYSPGWLADWSPWGAAGWRFEGDSGFAISPSGQTGCGDLQKRINDLYERIRLLERTPAPPAPACAPPTASWPCDALQPGSPEENDCICFRGAQGLLTVSRGASATCPSGVNLNPTPEQAAAARSAAHDVCNRTQVSRDLMNELYRLLQEQLRRHCPLDPRLPWPRPDPTWCRRHPQVCFRIDCLRSPDSPLCREWRLPGWLRLPPPPPPPDTDMQMCDDILCSFRGMERSYYNAMLLYGLLTRVMGTLYAPAPHAPSTCATSPACDKYLELRSILQNGLAGFPSSAVSSDDTASVGRAMNAVRGAIGDLSGLLAGCSEMDRLHRENPRFAFARCSPVVIAITWMTARTDMWRRAREARLAIVDIVSAANMTLSDEMLRHTLRALNCSLPSPLRLPPDLDLPLPDLDLPLPGFGTPQ